jgi:hypothetical protein
MKLKLRCSKSPKVGHQTYRRITILGSRHHVRTVSLGHHQTFMHTRTDCRVCACQMVHLVNIEYVVVAALRLHVVVERQAQPVGSIDITRLERFLCFRVHSTKERPDPSISNDAPL